VLPPSATVWMRREVETNEDAASHENNINQTQTP
jgi:hypothetical protein